MILSVILITFSQNIEYRLQKRYRNDTILLTSLCRSKYFASREGRIKEMLTDL